MRYFSIICQKNIFSILSLLLLVHGCKTGGGGSVPGNDGGSNPITREETIEYKKALSKCYKTGGSRIVKIEGQLKCY
ncbi:MAG: hypothetical protein HQK54_03785 [Oligoflexales bacterium]|nr:hypothetical protein [Oligoflexales bacterium]